jgi:hypothetical protein
MCVNASSGWWQLFLDTKTCESIPTPDGPTRASEEAPGARARKREDVATSKRQGGAGGGEEYATASGVDRRVRTSPCTGYWRPTSLPRAFSGTTTLPFPRWGTRFVPACLRPAVPCIQFQLRTHARENFFLSC